MAGIKDYSTTATSNTEVGGINIEEGMLPSSLNNAIRGILVDVREWYNDSQWIVYGDGDSAFTIAYASATTFTIASTNVTTFYHVGRRVRAVGSSTGTIYGTISATAFSTNTTVTVVWDSGSLQNETIAVSVGALSATNNTIPGTSIATTNLINGAVTVAKMAVNSVDSDQYVDGSIDLVHMSANSVDSDQYVDASIDLAHLAADSVDGSKIADDAIDSEHYADASIDVAHMSVNSIDSDQYVDGSIDLIHLSADSVNGSKIVDDAINSEHYTDGSIDLVHMSVNSIDSDQYVDGSIDTAHLAADLVNGTKIADDAIDSEHYTDASIDTAHIGDNQITTAKIADSQITSAKITDGTIVNADVNASAAIDATKIHNGAVSNAEFAYVNGVTSAIQTQINAKAATTYVDNAVAGLRTRIIAECASTANVAISSALEAGDTIDGITLVAGDRVLLKDQSTASENGLYTAVGSGAGAASRDTQFNSIAELSGQMVVVNQGSANDNKIFLCTTNNTASLGSDSITFTIITPSNSGTVTSVVAGTGLSGGTITAAGTIAIDTATTVDKATAQTLTNKTLTAPKINENVAVTSTATELNLLDGVSGLVQADLTKLAAVDSTAAELNIIDGNTSATSTTLLDADRLVVNDAGVMVQVSLSDVKTYLNSAGYVTDDPTALAIALG